MIAAGEPMKVNVFAIFRERFRNARRPREDSQRRDDGQADRMRGEQQHAREGEQYCVNP